MARFARRFLCFAALTTLLVADAASGHIKQSNGGWVFRGQTFENTAAGRAGEADAIKDPLNVVWYGGSGVYSLANVESHYDANWDASKVGGSGWRKHDQIFRMCKVDQIVVWRGRQGRDADLTDRHGSTAGSRFLCGNQHHVRLWDDYEHDKLDPAAHDGPADGRNQWVLGGMHYDKPVVLPQKCRLTSGSPFAVNCDFKGLFSHVPGRSWNVARHQMRRALHRLCGERAWKVHPGAQGWFQGFYSTGYLARMTTREKSQGCAGSGP